MIVISREARVKLAKHAWNVYPMEAFGYLLGKPEQLEILAALPCSKTSASQDFRNRWNGLPESFDKAHRTAQTFELEVVGFYGSKDICSDPEIPSPELRELATLPLSLIYEVFCCTAHSGVWLYWGDRKLRRLEDFMENKGRRLRPEVNQRRVHRQWLQCFGPIDYSNGYSP